MMVEIPENEDEPDSTGTQNQNRGLRLAERVPTRWQETVPRSGLPVQQEDGPDLNACTIRQHSTRSQVSATTAL